MKRWRTLPLSWRLPFLFTVILSLVLAVLGSIVYVQVQRFSVNSLGQRIKDRVQPVLSVYQKRPLNTFATPGERIKAIAQESRTEEMSVRALDVQGKTMGTFRAPAGPAFGPARPDLLQTAVTQREALSYTTSTDAGRMLVMVFPVIVGKDAVGVVEAALPLGPADELLATLRLYLVVGILVALMAGIVVGVPSVRSTLRPLKEMMVTAGRIASGDLRARLHLQKGHDEIGQLSESFNAMAERLEAAFDRQRQFVADAAHELKSPMAGLSGMTEMLLLGADQGDPAQRQRILLFMQKEIERLSRLVGDLLSLAKAEAGGKQSWVRVDLEPIALDVCQVMTPRAGGRQIECRSAGPVTVLGNPDELRRAILNLADNALKFTSETGQITISVEQSVAEAIVRVSDTGIGIPESDLPMLFERFYRGDPSRSRQTGGAGLGLAIVKSIVTAHGGTVEVISRVGEGTLFTVRLPLAQP